MSYPIVEVEFVCGGCGIEFEATGRWERCSEDDPYDVDFQPDPHCPECGSTKRVELIEDAIRCRVCDKPIATAELCGECAEGNDPFFTSKYSEGARGGV